MSSICASPSRLSNWAVPLGAAKLREILWAVKPSAENEGIHQIVGLAK